MNYLHQPPAGNILVQLVSEAGRQSGGASASALFKALAEWDIMVVLARHVYR